MRDHTTFGIAMMYNGEYKSEAYIVWDKDSNMQEIRKKELRIAAEKELRRLTDQINALTKQREEFILENRYLFAPFKLGQKLINKDTLQLGVVVDYYQYENDVSFNTHCKIMLCDKHWNPKRIIDNTSCHYPRQPWIDFEEYKKYFEGGIF